MFLTLTESNTGVLFIANRTWIRNLRRECVGWTEDQINELLTGVKVVGGLTKDLESEV